MVSIAWGRTCAHTHRRAHTRTHTCIQTNFPKKSNFKKPGKRLVHIWYFDIQGKTFCINSNIFCYYVISSTIQLDLNLITHTHYTVSCEQYHISVKCMVRISHFRLICPNDSKYRKYYTQASGAISEFACKILMSTRLNY